MKYDVFCGKALSFFLNRSFRLSVCCFLGMFIVSSYGFVQATDSRELIDHADRYDGTTLSYTGEIVGDIMKRGEFAWINVSDGKNSIGVWLHQDLLKGVVYTGSYKVQGAVVEVSGVFHRACPEHGGDLDLHAQDLRILSKGSVLQRPVNLEKKKLSLGLLGVTCLVLLLNRYKRVSKKNRKG